MITVNSEGDVIDINVNEVLEGDGHLNVNVNVNVKVVVNGFKNLISSSTGIMSNTSYPPTPTLVDNSSKLSSYPLIESYQSPFYPSTSAARLS